MFNHKFGKVRGSVLALSYDGKIAVKKANTEDYVRYNAETSTVENIKDLVINDNKWFFMIPATEVEVGDIIKYNDGFYQVIAYEFKALEVFLLSFLPLLPLLLLRFIVSYFRYYYLFYGAKVVFYLK